MQAAGQFKVSLEPVDLGMSVKSAADAGQQFARQLLSKQYEGDLVATSVGEMLSVRMASEQAAGYVAMEQVVGQLLGRQGQFVLQHFGTLHKQRNRLLLEVVPGSADGELAGLSGSMQIFIDNGQHRYEFDFYLPT
ncbi:DUF3224 domain-containing protein [Idiomarina xiamenensis]|uniref:DUF3224 domain-containing protein n=1 Tax=Idiomarina xiamenensis 10-D-4 TaxID=740709 RepID=K2KC32_9GAMM|nr:DUF3224 domain-containing protein [Idiomarina xiamenensis]EKE85423.1 hypothetical protein A10D4_03725 [Idiomarina xiamenensis 10-D-4]